MKFNFEKITIGSDPELFIINEKTNNVVSSIGLIPGVKGTPYRDRSKMSKGYGLETDNILAEFNIPPCKTMEQWVNAMNFMKSYIKDFVKSKNPDLGIKCSASEYVPWDQLDSDEAKLFGCAEDYNVYTEGVNPKPQGEKTNLRSAGVHIHIGYKNPNIPQSLALVKYMDAFLGVPSIILDNDSRRRTLYGKAGCFRLCPYGLEYRVLSGKFIDTDRLMEFMWYGTNYAISACEDALDIPTESSVIKAINESDVELARKLVNDYNLDPYGFCKK